MRPDINNIASIEAEAREAVCGDEARLIGVHWRAIQVFKCQFYASLFTNINEIKLSANNINQKTNCVLATALYAYVYTEDCDWLRDKMHTFS